MEFNRKKTSLFAIGIMLLMPVFLSVPAKAEADTKIFINFAVKKDYDIADLNLTNEKFLFGGEDLPDTYQIEAKSSELVRLRNNSNIIYAIQDSELVASRILTNDDYFTTDINETSKQWYLPRIKIPDAWVFGTGTDETTVAIIDTGIHASHVELVDRRVKEGYDVMLSKPIPRNSDSDDNGHGTAVAGVIGGITNNGKGIAGINWDVSLIPVKALDSTGKGSISSISQAIVWAADNGADIINLSVGGNGFGNDQTLNNAVVHAYNKGSVIVAAAGNDLSEHGINLDLSPVYPICADGGDNMVIGVAASDYQDKKAEFSNYGINCVDIIAPGKRILTTTYLPERPSNNTLIYGSGTSLAAPIVSGVAALLKSNNRSLTNEQIKSIILSSTDNIDAVNPNSCSGLSCNGYLGKGRINAYSVLSPQPLLNGTFIREKKSGLVYQVSSGKKRLVYDFVLQQRNFTPANIVTENHNQLRNLETDFPLPPLSGTLIKGDKSATVYFIDGELKRPLTYLVFQSRNFKFSDVKVLPENQIETLPSGEWYWPPDNVMVLVKDDPTVYVMHNGVKRPVTYFVFNQRRLSFASVVRVTQEEFMHIPRAPDVYWLPPLDNTLVKATDSDPVYIIQEGAKRPISGEIFRARNLKFSDIKVLPQTEIDVILSGPVLNH
ncbi:MAG: S8 family serine peptidase [Candidatus Doudnabacteria bacterium]|nr:S8 family serine peptidase [Candidatus Doudnabacteria bacterium]